MPKSQEDKPQAEDAEILSADRGKPGEDPDSEVLKTGEENIKNLLSKDPSTMSPEELSQFRRDILDKFTPETSEADQADLDRMLATVDGLLPQTPQAPEETAAPSQIPEDFLLQNLDGKTVSKLKKIRKEAVAMSKGDLNQLDKDELATLIEDIDSRIAKEERAGSKEIWDFLENTMLEDKSPEELDMLAHKILQYTFAKDISPEQRVELQAMLSEIKHFIPWEEVPPEPKTKNTQAKPKATPSKQKVKEPSGSASKSQPNHVAKPSLNPNPKPSSEAQRAPTPETEPKRVGKYEKLSPAGLKEWIKRESKTSLKDFTREELEERYVWLKKSNMNLNERKFPELKKQLESLINKIASEIRAIERKVTLAEARNEEGQTMPDHEQTPEEASESSYSINKEVEPLEDPPSLNLEAETKPISKATSVHEQVTGEVVEPVIENLNNNLIGKKVNWMSQGVFMFPENKKVERVERGEDGQDYVFVEGETTGFPIDQIIVRGVEGKEIIRDLPDAETMEAVTEEEAQEAAAEVALGPNPLPEERELAQEVVKRKWPEAIKETIMGISLKDLAVGMATGATIGAVARFGFRAAFGLGGVALGAVTGATVAGGRRVLGAAIRQHRYESAVDILEQDKTSDILEMVKSRKLHKLDAVKILNDRIQVYKKAEGLSPEATEVAIKLEELKKQVIGKEEEFNKLKGADRLNAYLKLASQNEVGESIVSARKKELDELSKEIARATGRRLTAKQLLKAATVGAVGGAIGYTVAHIVGSFFGDADVSEAKIIYEAPKPSPIAPVDTSAVEAPTDTLSAPSAVDSTQVVGRSSIPEQIPDLTTEERAAEAFALKQQAALEAMSPTNGNDYMTIEKGSYVSDTINKMVKAGIISQEDASLARNNPLSGGMRGDEFIPLDKAGLSYAGNQVHFIPGENGEVPRFEVIQAEGHQFGSDKDLYNRYKALGKEPPEWLKRSVLKGWDTLNGLPGGNIEASLETATDAPAAGASDLEKSDYIYRQLEKIGSDSSSIETDTVVAARDTLGTSAPSRAALDSTKSIVDTLQTPDSSKVMNGSTLEADSSTEGEKSVIDWILGGKILGGAAALGVAGYGASRIYEHMKSEKKSEDSEDETKKGKRAKKLSPQEATRVKIVETLSPKKGKGSDRAFSLGGAKEIEKHLEKGEFKKAVEKLETAWRGAKPNSVARKAIEETNSLVKNYGPLEAHNAASDFEKRIYDYKEKEKGSGTPEESFYPKTEAEEKIKEATEASKDTESIESKENEKHVSFGELEEPILNMLGDKAKIISPIEIVPVVKEPGVAHLRGEIDAGKVRGIIKINATVKNVGNMIEVSEDHLNISTTRFFTERAIKSRLRKEFASTIKKHFEDQYKKAVKSIQIKGSELVIITE